MKLLDLLATLSAQELADFDKHLKTAHAKERIALRAFAHFKQYHPRFEEQAQLDPDFLVRKLQRQGVVGAPFNRKQLSSTCSDLYGWLKDFLLLEKARDKSLESEYLWLTVLRERNMKAAHARAEATLFERVWEAPKHDAWSCLHSLAARYADCFERPHDNHEAVIEALTAFDHELGAFCEAFRHKVKCELLNRRHQLDATVAAAAVKHKEKVPPGKPLSVLYGMVEALFSGGGLAEYEALEAALGGYSNLVAEKELYVIWVYLKNYNSLRLPMGEQAAWTRSHRLDKFAWQYGLFRYMSPVQFLNAMTAAATLREYKLAASFTAEYVVDLDEAKRHEAEVLANTIMLFSHKEYKEVVHQLDRFKEERFREPHFAIRCRTLKLISMYELDMDYEILINDAVNFKAFLGRSEGPWRNAAKATLAFLHFYKKLFLGKPKTSQIMAEIKAAKPIYFEAWLLEKFENYRLVK